MFWPSKKLSGQWKPSAKKWGTAFSLKVLRLKTHHFHTKLPCRKPMLRNIEWGLQNGPITKNGFLSGTTFYFLNFVSEPLIKSWFDVSTKIN